MSGYSPILELGDAPMPETMSPREQYEQAKRDFNNMRDDGTVAPRDMSPREKVELPAVYEDEMDERYAVRSSSEYERQNHREVHDERMAALHGSLCHTAISDAVVRAAK